MEKNASRPLTRLRCALADPNERRRAIWAQLLDGLPECAVVEQASSLEELATIYTIDAIDLFVLDWDLFESRSREEIAGIAHAAGPSRSLLLVPFDILEKSDEPSRTGSPCIGRPDDPGGAETVARQIAANGRALKVIRSIEEGKRQAQKMEALGRLAAGISHDFNNLLTIISGYSGELLSEITHDHPHFEGLSQIQESSRRAAALTRQLLAFSRKQILRPRVVDLNTVVSDLAKMLRRLLGDHIELLLELTENPGRVRADPSQLEQVVINLTTNARDAMPAGGTLTIRTASTELLAEDAIDPDEGEPGWYTTLSITDTGVGMDQHTQSRVFDPFFTTKRTGEGTGLGLSTVAGIVRQSGGRITVRSAPGCGTCFTVFLRRIEDVPTDGGGSAEGEPDRGELEKILVVEDSTALNKMVSGLLQRAGYVVVSAENAEQALELAAAQETPIDLLLSDVMMPKMSGRELAHQLLLRHPRLTVVLMSGTTANSSDAPHDTAGDTPLIEKPFSCADLLREVRAALDRNRREPR